VIDASELTCSHKVPPAPRFLFPLALPTTFLSERADHLLSPCPSTIPIGTWDRGLGASPVKEVTQPLCLPLVLEIGLPYPASPKPPYGWPEFNANTTATACLPKGGKAIRRSRLLQLMPLCG